jgi:2-hydroxy-6-oxonona-2,4-dienedioate hydrolase
VFTPILTKRTSATKIFIFGKFDTSPNQHMEVNIIEEGGFSYIEKGQGETIVVLHGLFGALSNFKGVFDYFSQHFRVIIPIMPLYTMPIIDTNVKNLSLFLADFLEFKKIDKAHLLGNSLGGHVALVYASKYWSHVRSIILTGSSGLYENTLGGSFPKRGNYDYVKEKVAVTFYDPKHATKDLVDECFDIVNDKGKTVRTISLAKSAIRHNMASEIPNMNAPTCLIWGQNDTVTPPDVAEEFHELFPDSDLFWIDKCGHAAMMEHPDQFNKILKDWLDKRFPSAA